MGQVAQYETKKAYLCYDFGYELAVKWFGQKISLEKHKVWLFGISVLVAVGILFIINLLVVSKRELVLL